MGERKIHLMWLVLPSVVFFLLVAAFILKLPRRSALTTETPTASLSSPATPAATAATPDELTSLVAQIEGWRVADPRLAPPVFERKITLGEE